MPFLLRLPDALDKQVRDKAQSLGISINALLCVAADAYLRGGVQVPAESPEPLSLVLATPLPANPVGAPAAVLEPAKLTKAERRELTRVQRLQRK